MFTYLAIGVQKGTVKWWDLKRIFRNVNIKKIFDRFLLTNLQFVLVRFVPNFGTNRKVKKFCLEIFTKSFLRNVHFKMLIIQFIQTHINILNGESGANSFLSIWTVFIGCSLELNCLNYFMLILLLKTMKLFDCLQRSWIK